MGAGGVAVRVQSPGQYLAQRIYSAEFRAQRATPRESRKQMTLARRACFWRRGEVDQVTSSALRLLHQLLKLRAPAESVRGGPVDRRPITTFLRASSSFSPEYHPSCRSGPRQQASLGRDKRDVWDTNGAFSAFGAFDARYVLSTQYVPISK